MLWDWLRRIVGTLRPGGEPMARNADVLARYQHLRQVGLALNNQLMRSLPKSVLDEGGKKLGLLRKNVLTLDTEDELAVLADYCIHDVRRKGANGVERYLAKSPPPADSDEMVLLQALRQARFSLFEVEATEPGVGVHVHDLLRDESLFLVDIGFSRSAPRGMILAARIMAPEGIGMTTGAALPVGVLSAAQRAQLLQGLATVLRDADVRQLAPEEASEIATTVLRSCLQGGAAEHIRYVDADIGGEPGHATTFPPPAQGIGRNEPCPCGSGKKFKRCCGARR